MKVALLRCSDATDTRETNVTGTYPPLGLAYLGAVLQREGHEVLVLDGEAPPRPVSAVAAEIPPDVGLIGITSTTLGWPVAQAAAATIKGLFPRIPLVIGGPQVTAFPRETLTHSAFDLGLLGDGEASIVETVRRLDAGGPMEPAERLVDLPGSVFRREGEVCVRTDIPWPNDLDSLPMPALELLPMDRYESVVVRQPFITMLASRGCPYRCAFCSQIYTGKHFRSHSSSRILAEMERAESRFGVREVVLFDETFGAHRKLAREVCQGILERGFTFRWNARTRIDLLDEELLTRMREAGCTMLHLGIESGSPRILEKMVKGITRAQIERVVTLAHRLGYQLHGYFMLGYPGETAAELAETLAFSRSLPLDWASYTITIPNPRTELTREAIAAGLLAPDFWQEYTAGRTDGRIPYLGSGACSVDYLKRVKRDAYLRFYLRPGTLLRQSRFILETGGVQRLARAGKLWLKELL